jgi:methionyl-tRNA formyltransferase
MIGGELDNGDIIERDYFEVSDTTKIGEVWNWMRNSVPQLFAKALKNIGKNPEYILEAQSENSDDILRCYPRLPEDGQINWKLSSEEILRLINAASEPYSGAYCYFESEKMIIWDARIVNDDEIFMAMPGQITLLGSEYVEVACGNGKLRLNIVELGNYRGNPRNLIKSSRARLK